MNKEILSKPINDGRIEAYNVMTQMTLKEYFELVMDSMDKNDLQRAKVPSSKNIYSLLVASEGTGVGKAASEFRSSDYG